jgi:pyridinium-3,5-bisthiocarboxylic acid mononucleotide nickel chelatase
VDLHLNLSGGLTGDMFIAGVLDAFPRFEQRVIAAIDALDGPYPVACTLAGHSDDQVSGHRFEIEPFDKYFGVIPLAFPREPATWEWVGKRLAGAQIGAEVRTHATKIFELLVRAQASVLRIPPEKVVFEAGAWNSIAQVVGAAALINALGTANWSASALPGAGVTLTGAAIVDYLCPPLLRGRAQPKGRSLVRSGTGFGWVNSQSIHMRLLCFEADAEVSVEQNKTPGSRRTADGTDQQPAQ